MNTNSRRIGQYELQEQLGSGNVSEVWKAFDVQLQRYVAIKLLHANLQEDSNFVARFEREARLIASLYHPNIVRVHDFQLASEDTDGTTAYMVMEYVEGQTLADYIESTSKVGNIPHPTVIVQFFASICLAVHYAHENGMIHRDLKPANILLDTRNKTNNPVGEPILTDFGVAKLLGVAAGTFTNTQVGTPLYISPEQANGYAGNEHSDIYSLGVILYEIATGKPPFQGEDPVAIMKQHLNAAPPAPRLVNPNIPLALEAVILRCLAKDPGARFPDALALAVAVAEALDLPVPERLSTPTAPPEVIDMPTYLTPPPASIAPSSPNAQMDVVSRPTHMMSPPPNVVTPPLSSSPVYPSAQSNPSVPSGANLEQVIAPTPPVMPATPTPSITRPSVLTFMTMRRRRGPILLLLVLVVLLIAGSVGAYLILFPAAGANPLVGHAFFVSSGQLNDKVQGIADELQVDLQNIPAPPAGKSYYLWLLPDKKILPNNKEYVVPLAVDPPVPILLTNNLPVQNNAIHFTYPGDAQHNNLLGSISRLLITLDNEGGTPTSPSSDRASWKYYAQLPQEFVPDDPTKLRGLDHIRHFYYQETGSGDTPILARPGGLDIWVFRNTEKILEWSLSARDDFNGGTSNYQLMHNQFIRILDALDGAQNISMDVPSGTPILVDRDIALTSLLPVAGQSLGTLENNPPGDLAHMQLHLSELVKAPDASPGTRQLAQHIVDTLSNLFNDKGTGWLQRVHDDAKKLFDMGPNELAQPNAQVLLEDLATYATYAYIGQLDPATNKVTQGIIQAHYDIQKLAAFDVKTEVPTTL
jgi:eukaryotic-like serine/threonine-protein kinase